MLRNLRHVLRDVLCGRRSISAALIAIYFTTAAGIPLPSISRHTSGEAFPCVDHACGCDSAEQCWQRCCCFTLAEQLTWARRNGVRPPEFAIVAARARGIDIAWLGGSREMNSRSCHAEMNRHHDVAEERGDCCRSQASCCEREQRSCCAHEPNYSHTTEPKDKSNRIVAWRALGCHGHSLNWLAAVPSLVVVQPAASGDVVLVAWLGPAASDIASDNSSPPDVPPPECA